MVLFFIVLLIEFSVFFNLLKRLSFISFSTAKS